MCLLTFLGGEGVEGKECSFSNRCQKFIMWFEDVYKGRNDCGKPLSLLDGTKTNKKKKLLKKVIIFILKNKKTRPLRKYTWGEVTLLTFFFF